MALLDTLTHWLGRASRALGLETADRFPEGSSYPHTRWNKAYFDIASDLKQEQMEARLCESVANTPYVFAHIQNPTPRMLRALLAVIEAGLRRGNAPVELVHLLILAYRSPHTPDIVPGLRALIQANAQFDANIQAHAVLAMLGDAPAGFGVLETAP